MARRIFVFLLVAAAAWAADDAWSKVKALKTGTELRVYKKGSTRPILAQMDELTDDQRLSSVPLALSSVRLAFSQGG